MNKIKKVINFTPTGTQTSKDNSFAPLEPNEIIEEVHNAYELGITLTHIHARDPITHRNTYKKIIYRDIIEGIRKHCPDLSICVSLTGRLFPEIEKRTEVLELQPDMGSLTMSSINFPKSASINEPHIILELVEKMKENGVIPEIECFDTGMINYANYLIKKTILEPPFYYNVILGNIFNGQPDLATLSSIIYNKLTETIMCLGGIGKEQLKCNLIGMMYFDGVRVGLEDNLYYFDKQKTTNIELLKRIHRLYTELNLNVLTPSEFKQLGYVNKKINSTWNK